jgi:GTP-binding protein Era
MDFRAVCGVQVIFHHVLLSPYDFISIIAGPEHETVARARRAVAHGAPLSAGQVHYARAGDRFNGMQTTAFRSGFITILGAPNVGKSTLLNAIMGTKLAIVSPKPQTTRHRILGVKHLPHAQLIFFDTPGIHHPRTRLHRYMMQAVAEALSSPELVLYMTDVSQASYPDLAFLRRHLGQRQIPVFWLLNKMDRVPPEEVLPLIARCADTAAFAEVFPVSARRGDNLPALLERIVHYLPEGPRYFPEDMPTDRDERFLIAELIREQAILRTHEEVPHAIAVEVEAMHERADGGVEIDACLLVEKPSQKGILVGHRGQMIKTIGTAARLAIGQMLRCPVHLRLLVRVQSHWQDREAVLRSLGYGEV